MSEARGTASTRPIELDHGYASDRGLRRELNEDSLIAMDPVFAVADGMGGHEAGEVASGICVRTLGQHPLFSGDTETIVASDMRDVLLQADARIREITESRAGTTVTGVVLVEETNRPYWLVFNVGDSRTYRLGQGKLEQISVDHSEVQELVDMGRITASEARVHPRRHVVTQALGTGPLAEPDFWLIPVEEGDRMLVCSDGLTGEVDDGNILHLLSTVADAQDAADALVQAALRAGGRDNVTVIVVDAVAVGTHEARHDEAGEADEDTLPRPTMEAADAKPRGANPSPGDGRDDTAERAASSESSEGGA